MSNVFAKMCRQSDAVNEKNDCGVKCVAIAGEISYDDARKLLRMYGRKNRSFTPNKAPVNALEKLGYTIQNVTERYKDAKTIMKIKEHLPSTGTFIVRTYDHVLCFKDGEVCDWTKGRRHRIKVIWRVTGTMKSTVDTIKMKQKPPTPTRKVKRPNPFTDYDNYLKWRCDLTREEWYKERSTRLQNTEYGIRHVDEYGDTHETHWYETRKEATKDFDSYDFMENYYSEPIIELNLVKRTEIVKGFSLEEVDTIEVELNVRKLQISVNKTEVETI